MLSKFKSAIFNAVTGGVDAIAETNALTEEQKSSKLKFPYTRPHFLQLNLEEEILLSADKQIRPIIVPRDITKLPWNSGYAEAVNAGKSVRNEDQACMRRAVLRHPESKDTLKMSEQNNPATSLPYIYFSLFDGHAGAGAALAAANQLHHIVHEKLVDIIDHLLPPLDGVPAYQVESMSRHGIAMWHPEKEVPIDHLIVGALEGAFWEMDNLIARDRKKFSIKGGCTALVALFILGKVFIANAGDSRAVMVKDKIAVAMSNDFTPETERGRVRRLAALQPHLLGGEFTHLDYKRRPLHKDLGKRILYRDAYMMGWAYKTVTQEDLKIPVVHGEGKRSRVLATIGVTRGFGDHDLKALNCNIPVKPFLLSQPEVMIIDVSNDEFMLTDTDVLVMGTDGLWDVMTNARAAEILIKSFDHFPSNESQRLKYRYISAAQDLVMQSRGKLLERNWRLAENKIASTDDISVFVIPLSPYKEEYAAWKRDYDGIRGMYDLEKETTEGFGKLSLRSSPVASEKMSPHLEPSNARPRFNTGLSEHFHLAHAGPGSVIINGFEELKAKSKGLQKKDLEWKQPDVNEFPSTSQSSASTSADSVSILPVGHKKLAANNPIFNLGQRKIAANVPVAPIRHRKSVANAPIPFRHFRQRKIPDNVAVLPLGHRENMRLKSRKDHLRALRKVARRLTFGDSPVIHSPLEETSQQVLKCDNHDSGIGGEGLQLGTASGSNIVCQLDRGDTISSPVKCEDNQSSANIVGQPEEDTAISRPVKCEDNQSSGNIVGQPEEDTAISRPVKFEDNQSSGNIVGRPEENTAISRPVQCENNLSSGNIVGQPYQDDPVSRPVKCEDNQSSGNIVGQPEEDTVISRPVQCEDNLSSGNIVGQPYQDIPVSRPVKCEKYQSSGNIVGQPYQDVPVSRPVQCENSENIVEQPYEDTPCSRYHGQYVLTGTNQSSGNIVGQPDRGITIGGPTVLYQEVQSDKKDYGQPDDTKKNDGQPIQSAGNIFGHPIIAIGGEAHPENIEPRNAQAVSDIDMDIDINEALESSIGTGYLAQSTPIPKPDAEP